MALEIMVGVFAFCSMLQLFVLWRQRGAYRALEAIEARLARQADALGLLTETSEAGFSLMGRELERLGQTPIKTPRKPATRRMTSAARKGRTVGDIAAAEGVSEGEVLLRLHLAGQRSPARPADAEATHV